MAALSEMFATRAPRPPREAPIGAARSSRPRGTAGADIEESQHKLDEVERAAKRQKMQQKIVDIPGERANKFAEAVVVRFDEEVARELDMDGKTRQTCRQVAGRYWKIGNIEGSPVYRQDWSGPWGIDQWSKQNQFKNEKICFQKRKKIFIH